MFRLPNLGLNFICSYFHFSKDISSFSFSFSVSPTYSFTSVMSCSKPFIMSLTFVKKLSSCFSYLRIITPYIFSVFFSRVSSLADSLTSFLRINALYFYSVLRSSLSLSSFSSLMDRFSLILFSNLLILLCMMGFGRRPCV